MASVWLTSSTPLKLPPVIGTNALVLLLLPPPPHWTDAIGPNVSGLVRSSRQQGWEPPMDEPLEKKEKMKKATEFQTTGFSSSRAGLK